MIALVIMISVEAAMLMETMSNSVSVAMMATVITD